jgi:hypothetical protein
LAYDPAGEIAPMHEYEIRGFTRKCAATGEVIAPGATFFTVVRPGMPEYVREDFSLTAWNGPPEDAIAWWKSIATESGNRKPRVPSEIILEYFEQLEQDPSRAQERFVLALLMIRRRIFRFEGDEKDEHGRNLMELFCHRNEKTYRVLAAMPRTKADEREIEGRIVRLLDYSQIPNVGATTITPTASPPSAPPTAMLLLFFICLATNAGCLPSWLRRPAETPPPPVAYDRMPTLQEIVQHTNDHSLRVRQLQAEGATISYKAPPLNVAIPLQAKLTFDMPRRVRMTAGFGIGGDQVDVGSNDEIFWFWAKPADPTSIFYAKHEDYPKSSLGRMLPLDPSWIADALGLVYLDPKSQLDGPFPSNQPGEFDVRTWLNTPSGNLQRVITFDQKYGYVHSQYLYDPYGQMLVQIRGQQHRYDAASNVTLAHDISISLPQMQALAQLNVRNYVLNAIGYDNGGRLWEPPTVPGAQMVDMAAPSFDPRRYLSQPPGMTQKQTAPSLKSPLYPVSLRTRSTPSGWQGPRQLYFGSGEYR